MNTAEFMQKIESRFPAIKTEMGMDILKLIEPLSSQQLDSIWETFLDTYEYGTPPRRAVFVKIMAKLGIFKHSGGNKVYCYYCENCGMGYPLDIAKCYICEGPLKLMYSNSLPKNYMKMQGACSSCKKFTPFKTIGAECKYWGTHPQDWGLFGQPYSNQLAKCEVCPCKICCRAQRIYNTDYKVYREMLKNGELKGGWEKK